MEEYFRSEGERKVFFEVVLVGRAGFGTFVPFHPRFSISALTN